MAGLELVARAARSVASPLGGAGATGRAAGRAVAQVADDTLRLGRDGRPSSIWTTLSAEAGAGGIPRTDIPALARSQQHFRLATDAVGGVVELRLPDARMLVMGARGDGRALAVQQQGVRLLVERPAGSDLAIDAAIASRPDGPLKFQVDRLLVDDLAIRVVGGARTVAPPPHFRTGLPQPDVGRHVVRFDERGWEVTSSSLPRSASDYVHPIDETVQASFSGAREAPLTVVASYTGRVDGKAAEGPIASLRRGTRVLVRDLVGGLMHALEGVR